MSFVYEPAIHKIADGQIDLSGDDIRVALVGASTTADTENETTLMNGFTTLDECNATNYSRQAIANEVVNLDTANNRAEFDGDDVTFSAIGNGTNFTIAGAIVYKHVTDDTDSIPIAYLDNGGASFNKTTNGSDIVLTFDAQGIIQFTRA